ncbi:27594_t:CDS:1, partial [Racocetra persica]
MMRNLSNFTSTIQYMLTNTLQHHNNDTATFQANSQNPTQPQPSVPLTNITTNSNQESSSIQQISQN